MALHHFRSAKPVGMFIQLEYDIGRGTPRTMTIEIENANQLVAEVLNALRDAEQHRRQIPPIDLDDGQQVSINDLRVDQCCVRSFPNAPGRAFLELVAAGSLHLMYSFGTEDARRIGNELAATA